MSKIKIYGLAALAALAVGALCYFKLINYGNARYQAGVEYGTQQNEQKHERADLALATERRAGKYEIEIAANRRIYASLSDARRARGDVSRLQSTIAAAKQQIRNDPAFVRSGSTAATLPLMLADLLSEAVNTQSELSEEADRYYDAGRTCELQYDQLTGDITPNENQ